MLKRLIQCLGDAAFDVDATSIADVLWLLRHMDTESPETISTPTAPSSHQGETSEKPLQAKEEAPPQNPEDDQTGLHALTEETTGQRHAVKTFVSTGRGLPQALELARALRPFRARFRNPAQHELEVDATIERYAETGTLTPVLTPVRERWFSVDLVVDRSVSMSLWEDVIAETRSLLRQTGAFRTIEQWYLDPDSCELRTVDDVVVPPKRLRDPQERRLVVIVSDCIADGWREDAVWQMVRTWASSTPTALVNPLPPKLWRRTGLDHPAARLHAGRPGASNPSLRHALPPLLALIAPVEQWLPLPVVRLSPRSIAQWAGVLMNMNSVGCEGVLLPSTGRLAAEDDDEWSPDDRVHSFRLSASPLAWRTAVLSSVNDQFPLRLLRLIQRTLVPNAELSDLAEVVVSGLFREVRGADLTELTLKFREGVAGELREHLSKKDEWDIAEVLTSFLDDERASTAGQVAGLVIREGGEHLLPDRLRPYAHHRDADEGPAAQPDELPPAPLQTRGALFGISFNNRPFVPMLTNLLPDFSYTTHADLTRTEVLGALRKLAETSLDGPLVIAWSGHWTDGGDVLMLETADDAYVGVEELVKAGIASGARQILLLLDIVHYMQHSGPKIESGRWPALRGNTEWVGVVKSGELAISGKEVPEKFGRRISALLTQGPDGDEDRLRWLWGDDEVDGAELIAALQHPHGSELTVHQYGVPRPMLPNPLRGFRRTPPVDDHLLEAARGVFRLQPDLPDIDTLVQWVRSGECGVHAVVGPPATGKTMAVGYLAAMSNPGVRASILESSRRWSNIDLGVRSIDASVSVTGMSVDEIAETIGEQILERSWTVHTGAAADALLHLADVLAEAKGTPPVIVVDGVTECLDVRFTALFLAYLGACSTVIVTSREVVEELDTRAVLNFGPAEPPVIEASDGSGGVSSRQRFKLSVKIASPPLYPLVLRAFVAAHVHAGRRQQAAECQRELGVSLRELGRHREALEVSEEAVLIWRKLAKTEPGRYLPDLPQSLNSLGVSLRQWAFYQAASDTDEEAVRIRRQLAEMEPGRYLPDLADSLHSLGVSLQQLGLYREALDAVEEAVRIRRQLDITEPGRYLPDLAQSLNSLGVSLWELGLYREALDAVEEAVRIRRKLAEMDPGRYLPDLARSLNNLGVRSRELGLYREALDAVEEAVRIRRQLAEMDPGRYRPELAQSLHGLAVSLGELERHREALGAVEEAVRIWRRLAEVEPGRYRSELAGSLTSLGVSSRELRRHREALSALKEAALILRRLAKMEPGRYRPDLADSLHSLVVSLRELGMHREALDAVEEAVKIRRQLAKMEPGRYRPDLADSLHSLGVSLRELGMHREALDAVEEAVRMRR